MTAPRRQSGRSLADVRRDVGQLLIIGFEESEYSPSLDSLLRQIQPAGVILFARNILSPAQTYQLLQNCRKNAAGPIFTCVDMEGGRVDRFRKVLAPSPSAADVFATHDRRLFRKHGELIGKLCAALGFNVDFAPVLDLAFEISSEVMASRVVSADPKYVVTYGREFLRGLHAAGITGAGKHFPGLGAANLDTHHELPAIGKPWRRLWLEDLHPYRALRRSLPMVLIGHATYTDVTQDGKPASLSRKWIAGVLRKKIGYWGLVVSDDLEMGAVLAAGSIEDAAVEHIRAGGDLCLICRQRELVERAHEALIQEAVRKRAFARRVAESAARIGAFKKKSSSLSRRTVPPSPERIANLMREVARFTEQIQRKRL